MAAPAGTSGISGGAFTTTDRVIYSTSTTTLKDSTFLHHDTANGHLGINDTSTSTNALTVKRGASPGNFSFGANDIAFRNSAGESYLNNATTEAYFYSQNLPVSIYATAARTFQVTNTTVGVGDVPDANGRLYVYGQGTTSNFLSIANCNGIATTSSSGRNLAGYVRIYINNSVSNNGLTAFTANNYYIAVYS